MDFGGDSVGDNDQTNREFSYSEPFSENIGGTLLRKISVDEYPSENHFSGNDDSYGFYANNFNIAQMNSTLPDNPTTQPQIHNFSNLENLPSFYEKPSRLITEDDDLFQISFSRQNLSHPTENLDFYKPTSSEPTDLTFSTSHDYSPENSFDFYKTPIDNGFGPNDEEIERTHQQFFYQLRILNKDDGELVAEASEVASPLSFDPEPGAFIPEPNLKNEELENTNRREARVEAYEMVLEQLRKLADGLPDDSEDSAAICTLGCLIVDFQANISPIATLCELHNSTQLKFTNSHLKPLQNDLVSLRNLKYENVNPVMRDSLAELLDHTTSYLKFRTASDSTSRRSTLIQNNISKKSAITSIESHNLEISNNSSSNSWDSWNDDQNIWKTSTLTLNRNQKQKVQGKSIELLKSLGDAVRSGNQVNIQELAELAAISNQEKGVWGIEEVLTSFEIVLDKLILQELQIVEKCVQSLENPNLKRLSTRFDVAVDDRRRSQMSILTHTRSSIISSSPSPKNSPTITRSLSTMRRKIAFQLDNERTIQPQLSETSSPQTEIPQTPTPPLSPTYLSSSRSPPPLSRREISWVKVSSGSEIPLESDPAGYDFDGNPLFIARVLLKDGSMALGKAGHHLSSIVIPFNGYDRPVKYTDFEVLIDLDGLNWEDMVDTRRLPLLALQGGWGKGGTALYVARAKVTITSQSVIGTIWSGWGKFSSMGGAQEEQTPSIKTGLIPGKVVPELGLTALIGYEGKEYRITPFEVLVMDETVIFKM
ncbi:hypothetical protein HK096_006875 [Nowakowskiella sp. JEL0078]|nr:hypothetical protein HK096_006875 [Nowakowskiella sp. JEL0078]